MAYCCNCGTKLVEGAKFCHNCGTAAGGVQTATQQTQTTNSYSYGTQRKQEYVGKILKCSHCGAINAAEHLTNTGNVKQIDVTGLLF